MCPFTVVVIGERRRTVGSHQKTCLIVTKLKLTLSYVYLVKHMFTVVILVCFECANVDEGSGMKQSYLV